MSPPPPPPPGQPDQPGWGQPPPPGQPPPGQAPPPGWGQQQQPPPPPQYYGPYAQPPKTDGNAIAALCLAIGSFVFCPVVLAVVALVLASNAKKSIAASGGTLTGESLVQVATIVSWINIGLFVLGVVLVIILVAIGASTDNDAMALLAPALS
jgi:hypothetical protein